MEVIPVFRHFGNGHNTEFVQGKKDICISIVKFWYVLETDIPSVSLQPKNDQQSYPKVSQSRSHLDCLQSGRHRATCMTMNGTYPRAIAQTGRNVTVRTVLAQRQLNTELHGVQFYSGKNIWKIR